MMYKIEYKNQYWHVYKGERGWFSTRWEHENLFNNPKDAEDYVINAIKVGKDYPKYYDANIV